MVQGKKPELQAFLKMNSIDICCIQETHLNKNHRFFIRGYELYRQDREDRPKDGILTLVRNSLASVETHRSASQKTDIESITVNVILKDKHLTFCNLYSLPSKAIQLPQLSQNQEHLLAIGDFNSHSPSWGYKNIDQFKEEEVEGWIIANKLVLINKPDTNLLLQNMAHN